MKLKYILLTALISSITDMNSSEKDFDKDNNKKNENLINKKNEKKEKEEKQTITKNTYNFENCEFNVPFVSNKTTNNYIIKNELNTNEKKTLKDYRVITNESDINDKLIRKIVEEFLKKHNKK